MGVCLDTCQLHATGYDIRSPKGYDRVMSELDQMVGLDLAR